MIIGAATPLILALSANSPPWPRGTYTTPAFAAFARWRSNSETVSEARAACSGSLYAITAPAVSIMVRRTSIIRLMTILLRGRGRPSLLRPPSHHRRQSSRAHPFWQFGPQRAPLVGRHFAPARDLRLRAAAAKAEIGPGIEQTDDNAGRGLAHGPCVEAVWAGRQGRSCHNPVPAFMIGFARGRCFSSMTSGFSGSGCSGN